ncbi:Membrane fusion protein of RND family multidrug efflux pump [Collimonas arenae]|uniref:Membrane fusion protein of RND family multidrug efflux pump n=1 Tax=Collimonas arenae TaxID=279058 RepID=A0A0A1FC83_9BURK|nr:efflux RND transporter periplasmic adaptor subunit [Collimonas arenae]AIY42358.1 Membrane fusion protein of RND family multidrug efflux pump [Collimonas arenae]
MTNSSSPLVSPAPSRSRFGWRKPVILLLMTALAGGGWFALRAKDSDAKQASSEQPKKRTFELAASDVALIDARELRITLPLSGSLTPLAQATVKSKVAAEVRETLVREGMQVKRGQVIAQLDSADLRARYATQQATLDEAKAKLALANKNHDINQMLLKQKYISQNAFDTAHNSVEVAEATVKSASSQLEIAQRAMDDATIHAPIDGIISKREIQQGDKVSPDSPLFSIMDLSQMTLEAQVPASEIPRVKLGQDVAFAVDGFQERRFSGKVTRINPATEAGSRAIKVYIAVNNSDGALKGGMFAKGSITLQKSAVRPLLPLTALRRENGVDMVYAVENNLIVAQPVTLGLRNDDENLAEVTSGLAPGAHVIVVKLDGVKPGSAVKMVEAVSAKRAS